MSRITDYLTGTEQHIEMLKEQLAFERGEVKRLKMEMATMAHDLQQKVILLEGKVKEADDMVQKSVKIQRLAQQVSQQNKDLKQQIETDTKKYGELLANLSQWAQKEIANAHLLIDDTQHSNAKLMEEKQLLLTKLLQLGGGTAPEENKKGEEEEKEESRKRTRLEKEE